MLVVGPNRLFLGYIEHVLPSLGEVGVELAVTSDLVSGSTIERPGRPGGRPHQGRRPHGDGPVPGHRRPGAPAALGPGRALRPQPPAHDPPTVGRDRPQRPPPVPGPQRRPPLRRAAGLRRSGRVSTSRELDPGEVRAALRWTREVREALEWMWPRLTPEHLLHDLFGSKALLRRALGAPSARPRSSALHRPRSSHVSEVQWTVEDVPLLDEAHAYLGPVRGREEIRTFGHIVVDEAQDRSPMELRMLARRSLSGSMTIVGDIGQATGPWGAAVVGRRPGPPARAPPAPSHRADRRLPHPRVAHGAGHRRPRRQRAVADAAAGRAPR